MTERDYMTAQLASALGALDAGFPGEALRLEQQLAGTKTALQLQAVRDALHTHGHVGATHGGEQLSLVPPEPGKPTLREAALTVVSERPGIELGAFVNMVIQRCGWGENEQDRTTRRQVVSAINAYVQEGILRREGSRYEREAFYPVEAA